jgi:hypothetical protein
VSSTFFYERSELVTALLLLVFLVLADELGFRSGWRGRNARSESLRSQAGAIQGALLGLFALLLGFTFAMAVGRFEARKQAVVREANAIGTATLRTRLLPEPQRDTVSRLFRRYVDARLETAQQPNLDTPQRQALETEVDRLQDRLWHEAVVSVRADARSVAAGMFAQGVNDVIDAREEREAAMANQVPETVILLLFGFAALAVGVVGYGNGLAGSRALGATGVLILLITLVILLIIDLDRPGRGLIRVGQDSLVRLQQSLSAPVP